MNGPIKFLAFNSNNINVFQMSSFLMIIENKNNRRLFSSRNKFSFLIFLNKNSSSKISILKTMAAQ